MDFKKEEIMKKQKIQLIVTSLILIALVGSWFALKKHDERVKASESEPKYYALNLENKDDITGLSVSSESGSYELNKNGDKWEMTSDLSIDVDDEKVDSLMSAVSVISAEDAIENADDLSVYGLSKPVLTAKITMADGTSHELKIGDYNTTASKYYLCTDDGSTVYTVESAIKIKLDVTADSFAKVEEEPTEDSSTEEVSTEDTEETEEVTEETEDSASEN
ncbi:MAG: DUF4340 domain-containing protein [Butyrivibrio sp.]|nr:DUF4340 domain-containing protein [Butyrivibrio sp.]